VIWCDFHSFIRLQVLLHASARGATIVTQPVLSARGLLIIGFNNGLVMAINAGTAALMWRAYVSALSLKLPSVFTSPPPPPPPQVLPCTHIWHRCLSRFQSHHRAPPLCSLQPISGTFLDQITPLQVTSTDGYVYSFDPSNGQPSFTPQPQPSLILCSIRPSPVAQQALRVTGFSASGVGVERGFGLCGRLGWRCCRWCRLRMTLWRRDHTDDRLAAMTVGSGFTVWSVQLESTPQRSKVETLFLFHAAFFRHAHCWASSIVQRRSGCTVQKCACRSGGCNGR
jgi:hypothetical protein